MRFRFATIAAVAVTALAAAGPALGFDCIRVSSSLQGLQQSTRSGNWLLIDVSSGAAVQRTLESIGEPVPTDAQAQCLASMYAATGQPLYFAIGIGVAGPNGVLAYRNTNTTDNGKGIDHLENSSVLAALDAAEAACL